MGGLICGWIIHSKDGSPDEGRPASGAGAGEGALCRRSCRDCRCQDQGTGESGRRARAGELWRIAGRRRRGAAQKGAAPVHDVAPNNTVFDWALGDKTAIDNAFARARHVTKMNIVNNRLIPNAIEPRAAIGSYDAASDHFTLYTTSQNPHVARLVISAFVGIAPENKLRVVAPDVGGGFGSKIFIYAEEVVCLWASKRIGGRPVQMDGRAHQILPGGRAWARPRHRSRNGDGRERQDSRAESEDHRQYGRLSLDVRQLRPDLSLCDASIGPVQHPGDLCRGRCRLHQHRSRRCLPRGWPAGGDLCRRAPCRDCGARDEDRSGGVSAAQFHYQLSPSDTGHHDLRCRGLSCLAGKGSRTCRLQGFPGAQGRGSEERQAARHRLVDLHRGLRHRAFRRYRLARSRCRLVGVGGSAGQSGWYGGSAHGLAQPWAGP